MKRILLAIVVATGITVGGAAPAFAGAAAVTSAPVSASSVSSELAVLRHSVDDFSFESYTADYYLSRADDGTSQLQTVETFVAQFPDFDQNRGILRAIPLDYDGVELSPEVESVVDASGESVPFEEDTDGG
ncbi:MAG TPA: DUF2207 domain-containing protein, partial [Glaciihabitans sp.]|nr:DUF2207 domain-containing protein [Glaciihabitans sp.]